MKKSNFLIYLTKQLNLIIKKWYTKIGDKNESTKKTRNGR